MKSSAKKVDLGVHMIVAGKSRDEVEDLKQKELETSLYHHIVDDRRETYLFALARQNSCETARAGSRGTRKSPITSVSW